MTVRWAGQSGEHRSTIYLRPRRRRSWAPRSAQVRPLDSQVSVDARKGIFEIHGWSRRGQRVTLSAGLWYAAGQQSVPVRFTLDCQ